MSVAPKPECGINPPSLKLSFIMFDLLELINHHDDISNSSSWAIGSGQSKQASNHDFDSMMTSAKRAAVVKIMTEIVLPK